MTDRKTVKIKCKISNNKDKLPYYAKMDKILLKENLKIARISLK